MAVPPFIYIYHYGQLPKQGDPRPRELPGATPRLTKNRSEQALALGLFFSVRALGSCHHLTRLLAASSAYDLV